MFVLARYSQLFFQYDKLIVVKAELQNKRVVILLY